jgi:hypothetical protein
VSWFPDKTAQQAENASDEHTGNEHNHHAREVTTSAARLDEAGEPRYDGTHQDRIHAHLDEKEVQITDRREHFRNILREDAEHDTDNDGQQDDQRMLKHSCTGSLDKCSHEAAGSGIFHGFSLVGR